jgi:hypothetical protein
MVQKKMDQEETLEGVHQIIANQENGIKLIHRKNTQIIKICTRTPTQKDISILLVPCEGNQEGEVICMVQKKK